MDAYWTAQRLNAHDPVFNAVKAGRRVFHEPYTDTIRQAPENYLLACRDRSGKSGRFCAVPDAAAPINGHSLGLVLDQVYETDTGASPATIAEAVEVAFWGKLGDIGNA